MAAADASPSEAALHKLSTEIVAELDVRLILPYLVRNRLLTEDQEEFLSSHEVSDEHKVQKFTAWLPSKGPDFLDTFIRCLRESTRWEVDHHHYILAERLEAERAKAEKQLETEEELAEPQHAHSTGMYCICVHGLLAAMYICEAHNMLSCWS